jgi:DNA invertase Pin-like site-specific DNA recombinase
MPFWSTGRAEPRNDENAGLAAARERGVKLGRPVTLDKRAGEVLALKKQGKGVRVIARELGMAPSSVHSVLAGKKAKG